MAILPDVVGKTIDDFEIKSLIGTGAMGAVYKAIHTIERYEVALKVLPVALAEDRENLRRFQREAQTVAALVHPHIVPVYGYGTFEGMSYIVMKHLTGRTLLHWIYDHRNKLTPLENIVTWLNAMGSALDYAHQHGVIHRDIKPNNIMFDEKGNLHVVDFGIAKVTHATSTLTETGTKLGTPQYMAPEQWMAQEAVPATDQYAVGAMVYHLVTGEMPFVAESPMGLLHLHLNARPVPPHEIREDVPPVLADVINAAMAKAKDYRFPTVTTFARAFEEVIYTGKYNGTLPTAPSTLPLNEEPQRPSIETVQLPLTVPDDQLATGKMRRRRVSGEVLLGIGAVVLTLVVMIALIYLLGDGGENDPNDVAQNLPSETPSPTPTATEMDGLAALEAGDDATETALSTETPEPSSTATLEASATLEPSLTWTITPTETPYYLQAELLKAISVFPDPFDQAPRTFAAAQRSGFAPFVVGRAFLPDEADEDEVVEWLYLYYYDRGSDRSGRGELSEGWSQADELDVDEEDRAELDLIDPENPPELPEEFEYHVRAERPYGSGVVAATGVPSSGGDTNTSSGSGNTGSGNTGGNTGGGGGVQPTAPPGQPTYTPIPAPSISVSSSCQGVLLVSWHVEYLVTNNGGSMTAPAPYTVSWPGGSSGGNLMLGSGQSTTISTGSSLLGGSHNLTINMPEGAINAPVNCGA